MTAGSLLWYKKGIVKECVQKNALFFYICLDYPIKSDNDSNLAGIGRIMTEKEKAGRFV